MIKTRYFLEKQENEQLAPYATRSSESKGRVYPEPEAENRTAFQRDRDRIIHSIAFRRLEYKTQVFVITEGDHYRTRLTHTLEVVQIGRSIARALGANEELTEAICLAHDLGHPPFGHSGETALNKLMRNDGGFNHNYQSYRVVTELEKRYKAFDGLNLTYEVREGILKHETDYDVASYKEFNPGFRGGIEAQIANVADELAYTAHDLDDGLRSGILTPRLLEGVELWDMLVSRLQVDVHNLSDLDRHEIIRHLINDEITRLLDYSNIKLSERGISSALDVQSQPTNIIGYDPDMTSMNRQLKDFLYKNMYRNYRVVRMAVKAETLLKALFEAYANEPMILPRHIQSNIAHRGIKGTICDYIAGMTDRYAMEEYNKIFMPDQLP